MENNLIEQARKEIKDKYQKKDNKVVIGAITGAILGFALAFGSVVREKVQITKYINKSVVSEYRDMSSTLNTLKMKKDMLSAPPELAYEPEKIKPYLEKAFGEIRVKKDSLDNAIEIVEADLQEIKQVPEIKEYIDWEESSNKRTEISVYSGVGVMFLSMPGVVILLNRNRRKRGKELEALENN